VPHLINKFRRQQGRRGFGQDPSGNFTVRASDKQDILLYNAFCIFDDHTVSVELFHAVRALTDPDDVAVYLEAYEALQSAASFGSDAEKVLQRNAKALSP
jgi:hypothetical protein